MNSFIGRHPIWSLIIVILIAILLFLIFAVWPPELEQLLGRKRIFLSALLNGITLGGLYFVVASGFTLIFGLMRNVNLAHGSLYLFGGYFGYEIANWTDAGVALVRPCQRRAPRMVCHSRSSAKGGPRTCSNVSPSALAHPRDMMLCVGRRLYQVPSPPGSRAGRDPAVTAMRSAAICLSSISGPSSSSSAVVSAS